MIKIKTLKSPRTTRRCDKKFYQSRKISKIVTLETLKSTYECSLFIIQAKTIVTTQSKSFVNDVTFSFL